MLLDREEAEDAVQEASLKAWLKLRSFRHGADPRPWFLTIVANHCGDVRRRPWWAVVRGAAVEGAAAAPAADPAGSIDLRRALESLAATDRALMILRSRRCGLSPARDQTRATRIWLTAEALAGLRVLQ